MKSGDISFYNNKTNNLQNDWGEISSKQCGNEIRKAVLDFENKLAVEKNTTNNNNIR